MVGHATLPPWAWRDLDESARELPSPQEVWDSLGVGDGWEAVRVDVAPRSVVGPDGEQASMDDSIVVVRRLDPAAGQRSSVPSPVSSRSTSSASV